jgi:LCP family protein required for cell wall assembly
MLGSPAAPGRVTGQDRHTPDRRGHPHIADYDARGGFVDAGSYWAADGEPRTGGLSLSSRDRAATRLVRHGRLKTVRPIAAIASLLAIVLAVIVVSGGSVAALAVWSLASEVKPPIHLTHVGGKTAAPFTSIGAIEGGVNLLLTGTDTRTDQGGSFATKAELAGSSGAGNNDVTMLMHIAQDHQSVTVISFPRDMVVPIPKCGSVRATSAAMINSTLARGGLPCVVLTAESLTGLQIDYAAEISFDGVIAMSDAVGGVSVCLATPIKDKYTGLNLAAGNQTLVGAQALAFLRTRHGVSDGSDLARISNQQVFLSALARTVTSGGVLSNPLTLYSLAQAAVKNMSLSDQLQQPTTLVSIAIALKDVGLGNMVFLQYPTVSDPANPNRVVEQTSAANILNAALIADQPIQLTGTTGRAAEVAPGTATTAPPAAATSAPSAAAGSAPSTASGDTVSLPSSVTGQTAAQQTCTKGNG